MTRRIYRYQVPVDDAWHVIDGAGPPLHVDCRDPRFVEFWAYEEPDAPARHYRVYGTGHSIVDEVAYYVGTAIDPGRRLVWHLMAK